MQAAERLWPQFVELHESTLAEIKPALKRLSLKDEQRLARHCLILVYYEALFRAGHTIRSPLFELHSSATLEDLLALARTDCVDDVVQLSWAFEDDSRAIFTARSVLNPVFDGSIDVGGADADLIIGEMLCEFKIFTTINPTVVRPVIYQLLGYTLLDYRDKHGIREIGICFPRHRFLWRVPLWVFLLNPDEALRYAAIHEEPDKEIITHELHLLSAKFEKVTRTLR